MPITYVADANFLLRLIQPSSGHHAAAVKAARQIVLNGDSIVIFPQSLYEVYVVATRPSTARDGMGLAPADAKALLDSLRKTYTLYAEAPIFDEWERLVTTYNTSGVASHDTRYAALMLAHGLTRLLTFNGKDFACYAAEGISPIDPANL